MVAAAVPSQMKSGSTHVVPLPGQQVLITQI